MLDHPTDCFLLDKDLFGKVQGLEGEHGDEDFLCNYNIMKTENILLVLAIIIIILFIFSIFRDFVTPIPIIVQNPPVLTRPMYERGPRPCPFPFGCGRKSRPGRGGWFPTSLSIKRVGQNMGQNKHMGKKKGKSKKDL